jgi:hypothetical protein
MEMREVIHHFRRWFLERNISMDGLTLIVNFQDENPAAHFDYELRKDLSTMALYVQGQSSPQLNSFAIEGVSVRVESPLHPHDLIRRTT